MPLQWAGAEKPDPAGGCHSGGTSDWLPPKHFAELCERYERYFKGDGKVQELCFNDKVYHLCIQNVMAFPQDYAAMMTRMMEIREIPKVVGIDIGGFTSDYLLMRSGRPDMDYCDSLEKGVITMYNDIISSINSEYDMLLEEADIDRSSREKRSIMRKLLYRQ